MLYWWKRIGSRCRHSVGCCLADIFILVVAWLISLYFSLEQFPGCLKISYGIAPSIFARSLDRLHMHPRLLFKRANSGESYPRLDGCWSVLFLDYSADSRLAQFGRCHQYINLHWTYRSFWCEILLREWNTYWKLPSQLAWLSVGQECFHFQFGSALTFWTCLVPSLHQFSMDL